MRATGIAVALLVLLVGGLWWTLEGSHEARSASEQREATEPKAESPAPPPITPEPVPPRPPKLPPRAAGVGWFCIKSMQSEHMSTCVRTRAACDLGRSHFLKSGLTYSPCLAQETAACFTFVDRLEQSESYDCSATIAACERQRAYGLQQKADVSDVSDCGPVK